MEISWRDTSVVREKPDRTQFVSRDSPHRTTLPCFPVARIPLPPLLSKTIMIIKGQKYRWIQLQNGLIGLLINTDDSIALPSVDFPGSDSLTHLLARNLLLLKAKLKEFESSIAIQAFVTLTYRWPFLKDVLDTVGIWMAWFLNDSVDPVKTVLYLKSI